MSKKLPAQAFQGIEYVRRYYRVPAKRGGRVQYTNSHGDAWLGTITGTVGAYLRVRLDGHRDALAFHPTDVTYLEEGGK